MLVYYTVLAFGKPGQIAHIDWYDMQTSVVIERSDAWVISGFLGVSWYDSISPIEKMLFHEVRYKDMASINGI